MCVLYVQWNVCLCRCRCLHVGGLSVYVREFRCKLKYRSMYDEVGDCKRRCDLTRRLNVTRRNQSFFALALGLEKIPLHSNVVVVDYSCDAAAAAAACQYS
uniref:Secreted protein n=1 Tax=Syphacia muris TaxID=451379 RepID=A0A0N5AYI8_9BILA